MSPAAVSSLVSGTIAITGIIISFYIEKIRSFISRPNLEMIFSHEDGGCRVVHNSARTYIRVRVRNKKKRIATGCRVYLSDVKINGVRKILNDSPQLNWPYLGCSSIEIREGLSQYVDVANYFDETCNDRKTNLKFETFFTTRQLNDLERQPANCHITLVLVADHGFRTEYAIEIICGGSSDRFDAKSLN